MQISPVYDDPGFFACDLGPADPSVPLLRQRRRLAALAAGLDGDQWDAPSRCDAWSVRDVLSHLVTTNEFWAFAVAGARAGEPTRVLATFDPVATPAALVDAARAQPPDEVLDRFVATTEALAAALDGLDAEGWDRPGEAPPGHVPLRAVALHALWDAWVHERDIALPLGLATVEEPDEVAASLGYAAALGPAFAAAIGGGRGTLAVEATDPDVRVVVEVGEGTVAVREGDAPAGALRLTGPAVALVEGLSLRAPLPCPVPDDRRWLLDGLAAVFDQD